MSLSPGSTLGAYRIESRLGRGGMGMVFLATDTRLGRKVALKLLSPEYVDDATFRERFIGESRLAASIDHPHIIPVYDANEYDGTLYIAMRYVAGSDLATVIRSGGPMPQSRAFRVVAQVASALDAAHAAGLVHRDVKPGNILITPGPGGADHSYLSDFGLTKKAEFSAGLTLTGQLVGSVDYVAPEQIEGHRIDGRADVYSLGCVLYECLVGQAPYRRETDLATLYAHVQGAIPTVGEARPELAAAIDPVLERALAKRPEDRFSTAGELAVALPGDGVAYAARVAPDAPEAQPRPGNETRAVNRESGAFAPPRSEAAADSAADAQRTALAGSSPARSAQAGTPESTSAEAATAPVEREALRPQIESTATTTAPTPAGRLPGRRPLVAVGAVVVTLLLGVVGALSFGGTGSASPSPSAASAGGGATGSPQATESSGTTQSAGAVAGTPPGDITLSLREGAAVALDAAGAGTAAVPADVQWTPPEGASVERYEVERRSAAYSPTDGPGELGAWESAGGGAEPRVGLELASPAVHQFRVRAIGAAGEGPWAESGRYAIYAHQDNAPAIAYHPPDAWSARTGVAGAWDQTLTFAQFELSSAESEAGAEPAIARFQAAGVEQVALVGRRSGLGGDARTSWDGQDRETLTFRAASDEHGVLVDVRTGAVGQHVITVEALGGGIVEIDAFVTVATIDGSVP